MTTEQANDGLFYSSWKEERETYQRTAENFPVKSELEELGRLRAERVAWRSLLIESARFIEEEAENRSAAGSEMSDYEREPRDLAERINAALGGEA